MAFITEAALSLAIIATAVSAALALPVVFAQGFQMLHRSRLQTRVMGTEKGKGGLLARLGRRGIPVLRPLSCLLLRVSWIAMRCELCAKALRTRGTAADAKEICECMVAFFGLVATGVFLLTGMLVVALCGAALAVAYLFGKAGRVLARWESRLVEEIPDALRSLGICFNAGYSLQQAFEQTAQDTPEPLGTELRQASFDVCAGRSIEEALATLEKRTKAADLRFVVVALEIQHRTGGSLQELLETVADAVLASADLRRQLAVQTAQAQLSAKVVTILPLVLVAALSLAMEGYLQTFFSSPEGLTILFVALGMEGIGVLAVRRILGIDLG
ncbi:MAG: type II secretion system F family protein [Coriobacteriales bacterium]|jgi:tight adherence protein B|nr:type II secretion system F family protein [Coriobacteriales bacterium]